MKLKNKLTLSIICMFIVLLILPLIFINIVEHESGMGLMILLLFVINPITTVCLNLLVKKDIKKLWWIPITFSIIFLLSYWLILKDIIIDLIFYATIYLFLGIITMVSSYFLSNNKNLS